MKEVISSIKELYTLLERKNNQYVVLLQDAQKRIEQLKRDDESLKLREQVVVAKEIKYGIVDHAERLRDEAEKMKRDAEMLLEVSREERKTVAEWCDKEKRKAAQAIKDMDSFVEAIKQREAQIKTDRKLLEEEKKNFKNTIIKSFDKE